jgi:EAL domain-containing protein (putative c-di-GMP-specific phosphodiesterase class I)
MQVIEIKYSFNLDNIMLFLQPIMDLSNNAVWSYECLARLLTLDHNRYLPTKFLFLFEKQQSVAQLTQTVSSRSASYLRDINMAWNINLSLSDMTDSGTHKLLQYQFSDYPSPRRISIEITAQNILSESAKFRRFAEICHTLGINILIDEFDQRESDLQAIRTLPIPAIIVSATLFDPMGNDVTTENFIKGLISSAVNNKIVMVAEIIDRQEVLEMVKQLVSNRPKSIILVNLRQKS